MRKEKNLLYVIFLFVFIIVSVVLLVSNAKTGGANETFLPLLIWAVTAITCSILFVLDVKKKK